MVAMAVKAGHIPGWDFTFTNEPGYICIFCHQDDRPVLTRPDSLEGPAEIEFTLQAGVCEACAIHAQWLWRLSTGEVPPGVDTENVMKVSRVKVLISRLRDDPNKENEKMDPAYPDSYEILMFPQPDGSLDLPWMDVTNGETEETAAINAMARHEIGAWPMFLEPFHKSYTPRGKLVSIMLATAWTPIHAEDKTRQWRPWPLKDHVIPAMEGFYWAFESTWADRILRFQGQDHATNELSVLVREGARRYIQIQHQILVKDKTVDTSMVEYLRRQMTDDEKWVEGKIKELEEKAMELGAQTSDGVETVGEMQNSELIRLQYPSKQPISSSSSSTPVSSPPLSPPPPSSSVSSQKPSQKIDAEDDNGWPDDINMPPETIMEAEFHDVAKEPPSEDGFVRKGRPLTTKE
jgi:hypothetical protein